MSKLSNPVSILCIILPPLTAPEADSSPCYKQTNSACAFLKYQLTSKVSVEVLDQGDEFGAINSLSSIGEFIM